MFKAIVFDFDGVILESMDIKTQAFRDLFQDYPDHLDDIVKLHVENGGMPRFEKFDIIFRDLLKKPLSPDHRRELGRRFSELVFQKVIACPFVAGADLFLDKYSSKLELFVASGTPEPELRQIVEKRELGRFFRGVYGSPRTKAEIVRQIVTENGFHPSEVLFVGDTLADYRSACETSVAFVGRVPAGSSNPFPHERVLSIIQDLHQLDQQWSCLDRSVPVS
ncbi:MAG: HAD hydrolase-like protein [Thermodesulfobacteriota bacterium]